MILFSTGPIADRVLDFSRVCTLDNPPHWSTAGISSVLQLVDLLESMRQGMQGMTSSDRENYASFSVQCASHGWHLSRAVVVGVERLTSVLSRLCTL